MVLEFMKKFYIVALYVSIPILLVMGYLYRICRTINVLAPSKQWLVIIPTVILVFLCVFFTLLTLCLSKYSSYLIVRIYLIIAVVFFLLSVISLNIPSLSLSLIEHILVWSYQNNSFILSWLALAYYTVLLIYSLIKSKGRLLNES